MYYKKKKKKSLVGKVLFPINSSIKDLVLLVLSGLSFRINKKRINK